MSLGWIKLYASIPTHPKSDLLEAELNTARAWTHVVELWLWVSQVRPEGDVGHYPDVVLAKRAGWPGDPRVFVSALRSSGWLDDDGHLHGWWEHQGAYIEKADRDRHAKADRRARGAKTARAETAPTARPARAEVEDGAKTARIEERRGEEKEERRREREPAAPEPEHSPTDPVEDQDQEPAATPEQPPPPVLPAEPPPHETAERRELDRARATVARDNRIARGEHLAAAELVYERPQTVDALLAYEHDGKTLGDAWRLRFPALDGRGGRPSVREVVEVLWPYSLAQRWPGTARQVVAWFVGRLAQDHDKHRRSWERDGGTVASSPHTADPLWAEWRAEMGRGVDVPPFEVWRQAKASGGSKTSGSSTTTGEERLTPEQEEARQAFMRLTSSIGQPKPSTTTPAPRRDLTAATLALRGAQ